MKLVIISALVLGVYGTAYTDRTDYIRMGLCGKITTAGTDAAAANCTLATSVRSFLLRTLPNHGNTAATSAQNGANYGTEGACVNLIIAGNVVTTDIWQAANDESFALRATANANEFMGSTNSAPDCTGTWTNQDTGFTFTGTGDSDGANNYNFAGIGGAVTTGANKPDGFVAETGSNNGFAAIGVYHKGKRNIAMQLQGPMASGCLVMATANSNSFPLVVPLEASTGVANTDNEASGWATAGVCQNFKVGASAGSFSITKAYSNTTAGALIVDVGVGSGSDWTGVNDCVVGTTTFDRIPLAFKERGNLESRCVESTDTSATGTGRYFLIKVSPASMGEAGAFPAGEVCETCPGATPSSAASFSSLMAIAITVVAILF